MVSFYDRIFVLPVLIHGRIPSPYEKETDERSHYDSGDADYQAEIRSGKKGTESWKLILDTHEPTSLPTAKLLLGTPKWLKQIHGNVIEFGAGTCWLSAMLSQCEAVNKVYALDLSEKFLKNTRLPMFKAHQGDESKLHSVVSDFNAVPLESGTLDCVVLFASIHHSLAPIKTLEEAKRLLKRDGIIIVHEHPFTTVKIKKGRKKFLELSKVVTEIGYTRDELEYLFSNAGLKIHERFPLDIISAGGIEGLVRKVLRKFDVDIIFPVLLICIFSNPSALELNPD